MDDDPILITIVKCRVPFILATLASTLDIFASF